LDKKSRRCRGVSSRWTRRWFKVETHMLTLTYYDTKEDHMRGFAPNGSFPLSRIVNVYPHHHHHHHHQDGRYIHVKPNTRTISIDQVSSCASLWRFHTAVSPSPSSSRQKVTLTLYRGKNHQQLFAFDIVVDLATRANPHASRTFELRCDSEVSWKHWVETLEAYQNLSRKLFHACIVQSSLS
jgi:hypothetical protein